MRIVFFGNNERGCVCLEAVAKFHEVVGVVALQRALQPSWSRNMIDIATEMVCNVITVSDGVCDDAMEQCIKNLNPEVIVLAGWPFIIPPEIFNIASKMTINLHAGPVPQYRGSSVINWQIINGQISIGLSILQVDKGIDSGPVLSEVCFSIGSTETY